VLLHKSLETGEISARRAAELTYLSLDNLLGIFKQYELTPPFDL